MDWPDDGIFACPLGQFKLRLIDRVGPLSPSINGPARKTVDEQIRPDSILPSLRYEPKCAKVRIPFFFQQGRFPLGGAHLVQKPPERQIVAHWERQMKIDDTVGRSPGGAQPNLMGMRLGLLERIGFPVERRDANRRKHRDKSGRG